MFVRPRTPVRYNEVTAHMSGAGDALVPHPGSVSGPIPIKEGHLGSRYIRPAMRARRSLMPWVQLHEQFDAHPAFASVPPDGIWLYVRALFEADRLTGAIADDAWLEVGFTKRRYRTLADLLVTKRLWERDGDTLSVAGLRVEGRWVSAWHPMGGNPIVRWRHPDAPPKRRTVDPIIRSVVIERDGLRCGLCGGDVEPTDVHIDHILPVSKGGGDELYNLQVSHSRCNIKKGNRV